MYRSVLSLAIIALACGQALADAPRFGRTTPYLEARTMFRRLGYHPYTMPGADICEPDDPRCFPELENCAKSRTWACTYTWRRGKAIVEVETRYATPVVARFECVVNCNKTFDAKPNAARANPAPEDP